MKMRTIVDSKIKRLNSTPVFLQFARRQHCFGCFMHLKGHRQQEHPQTSRLATPDPDEVKIVKYLQLFCSHSKQDLRDIGCVTGWLGWLGSCRFPHALGTPPGKPYEWAPFSLWWPHDTGILQVDFGTIINYKSL